MGETSRNIEESGELLRMQLAITPHPKSHCVLADTNDAEISHSFKIPESNGSTPSHDEETESEYGCCHTVITGDDEQRYVRTQANKKCICPIFENNNCISEIKRVEHGSLVVVITVQNRSELRQLIEDLEAIGASISVDWLVHGGDDRSTTEIDITSITTKQQEALDTAVDKGYYETPRETNLGELADELEISESATSQRLNAAEMKLVKSFMND